MVIFQPALTYVKYGAESSYGDGGTPTLAMGVVTNFSPTVKNNIIPIIGIGEGRDRTAAVYGSMDVSGTIDTYVTPETFSFMQYLIGARLGAGETADPYYLTEADTITPGGDIGTLGIEVGSEAGATDDVDTYDGVHLISGTLTATQGELFTGSFNWVAQSITSSTTAGSYTAAAFTPYTFQQGSFKWGTTPSSVAKVSSFSLTMNNNSFIYRSIGSREIEQPETGQRHYEFTITVKMTDTIATTLRDNLYGQANSPVTGIANPTANYEIELGFITDADSQAHIYLDQCHLEDMSKPVPVGSDLIEATFTGWAQTGGNTTYANIPIRWWTSA